MKKQLIVIGRIMDDVLKSNRVEAKFSLAKNTEFWGTHITTCTRVFPDSILLPKLKLRDNVLTVQPILDKYLKVSL